MSIEDATCFIERVRGDEALQERLRTVAQTSMPQALTEVVQIGSTLGHTFTPAEYVQAVKLYLDGDSEVRKLMRGEYLHTDTSFLGAWMKVEMLGAMFF